MEKPERTEPTDPTTQQYDLEQLAAEMKQRAADERIFRRVKQGFDEALLGRTLMDPDGQVFYYVDTKRKEPGSEVFVKKSEGGAFEFVQEEGDDEILLLLRPLGEEQPRLFDTRTVDFREWRILTEMTETERQAVDAEAKAEHERQEAA